MLQSYSLYLVGIHDEFSNQISITIAVTSISFSMLIIVSILSSKEMRKKTYLLLIGVSVFDVIQCIAALKTGVYRLIMDERKEPMVYSQLHCFFEELVRAISPVLSRGFFCLIAIDRFLAVCKPFWYKSKYPSYLFPVLVLLNFLQSSLDLLLAYLGINDQILTPWCTFQSSTSAAMLSIITTKNTVLLVVTIFVYVASIALVYFRLRKVKQSHGDVQAANKELQITVIWTLAMIVGSYTLTMFASSMFLKWFLFQSIEVQMRFSLIPNALLQIQPIVDFVVLMLRNKSFRSAFRKCFQSRNIIVPSSTTSGHNAFLRPSNLNRF